MMDAHARLVAVVADATSAGAALDAATRVIAEAVGAEACSLFVRCENAGLQQRAHFGPAFDAATLPCLRHLAESALADVLPANAPSSAWAVVAVPVASMNHAIGAIVAQRRLPASFTAEEIMRLSGMASQIAPLIETARLVESIERGEPSAAAGEERDAPPLTGEMVLAGVAASPGIAMGAATFRNTFPRELVQRETAFRGASEERARARDAFQKTRNDLVRLQSGAASEIGEEQALIFGAHLLLLNDPMFTAVVEQGIVVGRSAPIAVDLALDEIARRFREARDPYVQERVEDLEDVRSRVLGHLVGAERPQALEARIVVSSRTTPSLVVELKARGALAIVSELGGATSHGVLLARALAVPAVTGVERLTERIAAGDALIVDGDEGRVVVRPTAETAAEYARRIQDEGRKHSEYFRYRDEPARTADGVHFELQANIALGVDLAVARENRAGGIGLYRTEFPFIVRDGLPSVGEQVRIYSKAYEAFPSQPVTFRLLDVAGDKFLPSRRLGASAGAFHGYRSIRILFDYPYVLRDQVQAFAIAAAGRRLRILIPMVSSVEDVVRIKELVAAALAQCGARAEASLTFGAMVETPAAVEIVRDLAREVDFFSIGTNDLIQYTLVVDREDPRLSSERDAYHPAILRMIRRVVTRAHAAGKPVAVCGEMAARPELAIALLAMEVDALSVTPRVIPELKRALARVAVEPLRARIDAVLASPTGAIVEARLREYMRDAALRSR